MLIDDDDVFFFDVWFRRSVYHTRSNDETQNTSQDESVNITLNTHKKKSIFELSMMGF